MKDVRFYLEFPSSTIKHKSGKANTGHSGNVFAAFTGNGPHYSGRTHDYFWEGLGSIFDSANSPVASTSASVEKFIGPLCKRIPERLARIIHPRLFERLDSAD